MQKRLIFKIALSVLIVLALIYLYLLKAVNNDQKEFEKMMKNNPDSIRINDTIYHFRKDTAK